MTEIDNLLNNLLGYLSLAVMKWLGDSKEVPCQCLQTSPPAELFHIQNIKAISLSPKKPEDRQTGLTDAALPACLLAWGQQEMQSSLHLLPCVPTRLRTPSEYFTYINMGDLRT